MLNTFKTDSFYQFDQIILYKPWSKQLYFFNFLLLSDQPAADIYEVLKS